MKKIFKGCFHFFAIVGGSIAALFLIYGIYTSFKMDSVANNRSELGDKHCQLQWDELTYSQKKQTLEEFIKNDGTKGFGVTNQIMRSINNDVANFETVRVASRPYNAYTTNIKTINPRFAKITYVEEGLIMYSFPLSFENQYSVRERHRYGFLVRYIAGCHAPEILSAEIL